MARFLYLARHGETDWNSLGRLQGHTDIPLNVRGREQAVALASMLRQHALSDVIASDLSRAAETAEIVAGQLSLPRPRLDARLRERSFGAFEGRTKEELARSEPVLWASYSSDVRVRPPGGESHEELAARVREGLLDAGARLPEGGSALVVSHGGAIRALILAAFGRAIPPVGNGAVFRIVWDDGKLDERGDAAGG